MVVDVLSIQPLLQFDYYFYSFLDPLQALTQTAVLYLLVPSTALPHLLKFSFSRLTGLVLKLVYVVGYLLYRRQSLIFWRLQPITDPDLKLDYYIHPSSRQFQKSFGISTLIFFASNNIERLLQVRLFSLDELGYFGFLQSTLDNLFLLTCQPVADFLTNFFNLKLNLFWHTDDPALRANILAETRSMYLHTVKYIAIFFEMLFVYGSYVFLDSSVYPIFGSNYGNRVG